MGRYSPLSSIQNISEGSNQPPSSLSDGAIVAPQFNIFCPIQIPHSCTGVVTKNNPVNHLYANIHLRVFSLGNSPYGIITSQLLYVWM